MIDELDRIMAVMEAAFDPAFGEAWTRRQVSDSLLMPNTHYLLAGADGHAPCEDAPAAGFTLSRGAFDEEELLLIAVSTGLGPEWDCPAASTARLAGGRCTPVTGPVPGKPGRSACARSRHGLLWRSMADR